jgi:hypothetical protein
MPPAYTALYQHNTRADRPPSYDSLNQHNTLSALPEYHLPTILISFFDDDSEVLPEALTHTFLSTPEVILEEEGEFIPELPEV